MRRTIYIKARDKNTKISIIAKIKTDGYLVRDEVNDITESLREALVDTLRSEVIKFSPHLSEIDF